MRMAALVMLAALGSHACAELGYRDRVLHRVPSPVDRGLIAVCQEIPEFDGPSYDIRLERTDGTVVRHLARLGDGDPCHEMARAADGRTLAVLSSQDTPRLARRLRFVFSGEIECEVCAHQFGRGIDWRVCTVPPESHRLRLDSSLRVGAHRSTIHRPGG
jgi:hypothetical protein